MKTQTTKLKRAKDVKNDEFYTLYEDIEKELSHYENHIAVNNKAVFTRLIIKQRRS